MSSTFSIYSASTSENLDLNSVRRVFKQNLMLKFMERKINNSNLSLKTQYSKKVI